MVGNVCTHLQYRSGGLVCRQFSYQSLHTNTLSIEESDAGLVRGKLRRIAGDGKCRNVSRDLPRQYAGEHHTAPEWRHPALSATGPRRASFLRCCASRENRTAIRDRRNDADRARIMHDAMGRDRPRRTIGHRVPIGERASGTAMRLSATSVH